MEKSNRNRSHNNIVDENYRTDIKLDCRDDRNPLLAHLFVPLFWPRRYLHTLILIHPATANTHHHIADSNRFRVDQLSHHHNQPTGK